MGGEASDDTKYQEMNCDLRSAKGKERQGVLWHGDWERVLICETRGVSGMEILCSLSQITCI